MKASPAWFFQRNPVHWHATYGSKERAWGWLCVRACAGCVCARVMLLQSLSDAVDVSANARVPKH